DRGRARAADRPGSGAVVRAVPCPRPVPLGNRVGRRPRLPGDVAGPGRLAAPGAGDAADRGSRRNHRVADEAARVRATGHRNRGGTVEFSRSRRIDTTTDRWSRDMIRVVSFDHLVLNVSDIERSMRWYMDMLGLKPVRLEEWRRGECAFPSVRVSEHT